MFDICFDGLVSTLTQGFVHSACMNAMFSTVQVIICSQQGSENNSQENQESQNYMEGVG